MTDPRILMAGTFKSFEEILDQLCALDEIEEMTQDKTVEEVKNGICKKG